jgi:hypothetical protein
MRHHGSNPLKYQDHRVELRLLPLKPMECEIPATAKIICRMMRHRLNRLETI